MEEILYNKLKNDLLPLYNKVKSAILLVEGFDEKQEMYIAPMNELRNALDHIFSAVSIVSETQKCDYELKEAKEHMVRAGYDALELLAGSLGTTIVSKLRQYDTETLTQVFPDYFTSIKPTIAGIQQSLIEKRMKKKVDIDVSFCEFFDEIKELVEINNSVDKKIPSLQEYSDRRSIEKQKQQIEEQNKIKKERLWQYGIGSVIGFIFAAILAVLTWLLTK